MKSATADLIAVLDLIAALDMAVMERLEDGSLRMIGITPEWFMRLVPNAASRRDKLKPEEEFLFLENFLVDAQELWEADEENRAARLKSGPWAEIDPAGDECHLEASAVCLGDRKILLIEFLGAAYEEKRSMIQQARETTLRYQRLVEETQKTEVLLDYIAHDLAGFLPLVARSLEVIASRELSPDERDVYDTGVRRTAEQAEHVQDILSAFSIEVQTLEPFALIDPDQAPDAGKCAAAVVEALLPTFELSRVTLRVSPAVDPTADWRVVGEKSRLERVLSNLIGNALRRSPPHSTVTIHLVKDAEAVRLMIDDEGPDIAPESAALLFSKLFRGNGKSGAAGLGLYFCRMMVERWGGEIACTSRAGGGARFWFHLPVAPERSSPG